MTPDLTRYEAILSFQGPNRWLSNFYFCRIVLDDRSEWVTAEHAYQASKFTDPAIRHDIRMARTPGIAKAIARSHKRSIRPDWDGIKIKIMRQIIKAKFCPLTNPLLVSALLTTGDAQLVESNWWGDRFWGVYNGKGENWLGLLLMERRDQLRVQQSHHP